MLEKSGCNHLARYCILPKHLDSGVQSPPSPSSTPPLWSWVEFVEELSVFLGDVAIAAWPSSFSVANRCQWTFLLVDRTETFADAFAFLQLRFQCLFFGCGYGHTTVANKLASTKVIEIVHAFRSELHRAQCFVADITCVQAHIMGCAAFGTTNFAD